MAANDVRDNRTWAATTTCLRAVGQAREALKELVAVLVRDCMGVVRIIADCMVLRKNEGCFDSKLVSSKLGLEIFI